MPTQMNTLRLLAVSFILISSATFASELHVPASYPTIQSAINAASEGDTVIVAPGSYVENVVIDGKNVTLRSTDPSDAAVVAATVIDGNQTGPCVSFVNALSSACITGFTLTNGDPGVNCYSYPEWQVSTPRIMGNVITNCTKALRSVGSAPEIIRNTIEGNSRGLGLTNPPSEHTVLVEGNTIAGNGSGIELHSYFYPRQTRVVIADNNVICNENGGIVVEAGICSISNNLVADCPKAGISCGGNNPDDFYSVTGNTITRCAGGIGGATVASGNTVCDNVRGGIAGCEVAIGNTVTNNGDGTGAAVHAWGVDDVLIQDNIIAFNRGKNGGGIYLDSGAVLGNTIIGNEAATGGGIYCDWGGLISNNIIRSNSAAGDGGGIYLSSIMWNTTVIGNMIVANIAGGKGGGALLFEDDGILASNTIVGNRAATGGAFLVAGISQGYLLNNSVISLNSSTTSGSPIECWDNERLRVSRCLIEGGQAAIGGHGDCIWGPGNIDADPLFVDPGCWDDAGTPYVPGDDVFIPGDYRLLPGSPCIDAGTNDVDNPWSRWEFETLPETDLAGVKRIIDGNLDGAATVDIGAYEYLPGDANGDGRVNLLDLLRIRNSLGLDPSSSPDARGADVNGDGRINLLDLLLARRQFQSR